MILRPFFSYYGGKHKIAARYPKPIYDTIVEPFAGGAGYSTRYSRNRVILVERNPIIAAIWRYLISASQDEIMLLPMLGKGENVKDLKICEEARYLIGFNLGAASFSMRYIASPWSMWTKSQRLRIALQVERIRHWTILEGDYTEAPNVEATWFIDPPYQSNVGRAYTYNEIDYHFLGEWCKDCIGQAIVCENEGANWLPFKPFIVMRGNQFESCESIYTQENIP